MEVVNQLHSINPVSEYIYNKYDASYIIFPNTHHLTISRLTSLFPGSFNTHYQLLVSYNKKGYEHVMNNLDIISPSVLKILSQQ